MADLMRPAWAAIDLAALQHNVKVIRKLAGGKRILAILKANAYGHGLQRIAQALSEIDAIGVARVDEALQLRNAGVTRPIVLLEGFFDASQIPVLAASNIQPVIHNLRQMKELSQVDQLGDTLKVWLKIDTGMHRLGLEPDQVVSAYQQLLDLPQVSDHPVVISHLACADEPEHPQNQRQIELFATILQQLPPSSTSLVNSAALLAQLAPQYDWVRPGLALYGVSPFATKIGADHDLKAVMNLRASIISVRQIKAGEAVGYGGHWVASEDTHIGIVAIGYGDGYPRHAPEGTPVLINGDIYPLVGRVAMDMVTVNLGRRLTVKLGDTAELWGAKLPVERVAEAVGTIPYELLCNVARRVQLEYQ